MSDSKDKCLGIIGWLFGHNMRGRYTTESKLVPRDATGMMALYSQITFEGQDPVETRDWRKSTYHGDVCTRCGKTLSLQRRDHGNNR